MVSGGLLIFWFHISGDQEAGYQNDAAAVAYDYNYENQDYVEEPQPSLIPQFTTQAEHFKVAKDRILRLPCRVDQLGKPSTFDPFFVTLKLRNMNYCLCLRDRGQWTGQASLIKSSFYVTLKIISSYCSVFCSLFRFESQKFTFTYVPIQ